MIDEIGFVPLHKDAAELLFQVISDCYERKSLIITSNLEFSQWNTVFGDNRLTAALVDRLIHHRPYCDFLWGQLPAYPVPKPPEGIHLGYSKLVQKGLWGTDVSTWPLLAPDASVWPPGDRCEH